VRASIAESSIETNLGLGVIIALELVEAASKCFATRRRVTSVSVNIPTNPPPGPVSSAASPLFLHNICTIDNTLSDEDPINGFLGRSLDTGLSTFLGTVATVLEVRDVRTEREALCILCIDPVSEKSSAISIVLSNNDLHPSEPPHPFIISITSTTPIT